MVLRITTPENNVDIQTEFIKFETEIKKYEAAMYQGIENNKQYISELKEDIVRMRKEHKETFSSLNDMKDAFSKLSDSIVDQK